MKSSKVVAAAAAVALLVLARVDAAIFPVDAGGRIPPLETAGTSIFTFTVTGEGFITDVDIQIAIAHEFDDDLSATLESPSGTLVVLFGNLGGEGDNYQDTLFDDSAPTDIANGSAPFAGTFNLQGSAALSSFNGEPANGQWILTVNDRAVGDFGFLFKPGDDAPWGEAEGTRLILTTRVPDGGVIPEPMTAALLAGAALTLGLRRRRA